MCATMNKRATLRAMARKRKFVAWKIVRDNGKTTCEFNQMKDGINFALAYGGKKVTRRYKYSTNKPAGIHFYFKKPVIGPFSYGIKFIVPVIVDPKDIICAEVASYGDYSNNERQGVATKVRVDGKEWAKLGVTVK